MKSASTVPNNRRISFHLASLATGLALATFAIIGAGEILGEKGHTNPASSATRNESPAVGPVMNEPDFGSVAGDFAAFHPSVTASRTLDLIMNEPDFGSVSGDYLAFGHKQANDSLEVVDPHFGTGPGSVAAIEGDYLQ